MNRALVRVARRRRHARGIAAVEMACILLVLFLLIPSVFFFGRGIYHYGVVKQATSDAANFVATTGFVAITSDATRDAVVEQAESMVRNALAEAGIQPDGAIEVQVACHDRYACNQLRPTMVRVSASYGMQVTLFNEFLGRWFDTNPIWMVQANTIVPYAN